MESIDCSEMKSYLQSKGSFFKKILQGLEDSSFLLDDVTDLVDFKDRTIKFERWNEEINELFQNLVQMLEKKAPNNEIRGLSISRYTCEIKVGIRYCNEKVLSEFNEELDKIMKNVNSITNDTGFSLTKGICHNPPVPPRIVVDYIKCKSFDWYIKLNGKIRQLDEFKKQIEVDVINSNVILRIPQIGRSLNNYEVGVVWERFIHHILNISPMVNECDFKEYLWRKGIPIL